MPISVAELVRSFTERDDRAKMEVKLGTPQKKTTQTDFPFHYTGSPKLPQIQHALPISHSATRSASQASKIPRPQSEFVDLQSSTPSSNYDATSTTPQTNACGRRLTQIFQTPAQHRTSRAWERRRPARPIYDPAKLANFQLSRIHSVHPEHASEIIGPVSTLPCPHHDHSSSQSRQTPQSLSKESVELAITRNSPKQVGENDHLQINSLEVPRTVVVRAILNVRQLPGSSPPPDCVSVDKQDSDSSLDHTQELRNVSFNETVTIGSDRSNHGVGQNEFPHKEALLDRQKRLAKQHDQPSLPMTQKAWEETLSSKIKSLRPDVGSIEYSWKLGSPQFEVLEPKVVRISHELSKRGPFVHPNSGPDNVTNPFVSSLDILHCESPQVSSQYLVELEITIPTKDVIWDHGLETVLQHPFQYHLGQSEVFDEDFEHDLDLNKAQQDMDQTTTEHKLPKEGTTHNSDEDVTQLSNDLPRGGVQINRYNEDSQDFCAAEIVPKLQEQSVLLTHLMRSIDDLYMDWSKRSNTPPLTELSHESHEDRMARAEVSPSSTLRVPKTLNKFKAASFSDLSSFSEFDARPCKTTEDTGFTDLPIRRVQLLSLGPSECKSYVFPRCHVTVFPYYQSQPVRMRDEELSSRSTDNSSILDAYAFSKRGSDQT